MDKKDRYKYIQEYKKQNYARLVLELRPGEKDEWKRAAASQKLSMQGFIKSAVYFAITYMENNDVTLSQAYENIRVVPENGMYQPIKPLRREE